MRGKASAHQLQTPTWALPDDPSIAMINPVDLVQEDSKSGHFSPTLCGAEGSAGVGVGRGGNLQPLQRNRALTSLPRL